ncbi:hypothetical protein B0H14DRAFT_2594167 [Mycena olivaceomarginata]|nr:hypothetical protein B0H14DRAFT_2594167 [Mycena olivaceomarginata]
MTNVPMLPHPGTKDWKVEAVLRKQRYQRSAGTPREFKFSWFERDWFVQQDPEVLPPLIHRAYQNNRCYMEYFSENKSSARDTDTTAWLSGLRLSPTPELESLMQPPMQELMNRSVLGISPVERRRRVLSIGAAWFQLLAIQHELNEELNLNGDTLLALLDGLTTDPLELKHRRRWDLDRFS